MANLVAKSKFVPKYEQISEFDLEKLSRFILDAKKLFVLSGAGLSTESGIPDYRSEGVGLYSRTNHKPIQHLDFISSAKKRKIYWARNYTSWPLFSSFTPNISHRILSDWERKCKINHHVTQNVDGLMIKAGCLRLTELHGSSYKVKCLDCNLRLTREATQILIKSKNPNWSEKYSTISPDNDVFLSEEQIKNFVTPTCPSCNNDRLKPEIVFFGDSIPKPIVEKTNKILDESDSLLIVGSSLQVFSAYRLVLRANERNIPICIINIGPTRGDKYANLKINTNLSDAIRNIKL